MTPTAHAAAEADILRHVARYAGQGLIPIARRFHRAVLAAIDALTERPDSGTPRPLADPTLAGLRAWPVKGFDDVWVFYLSGPDRLTVARVLHGKRDLATTSDARTPPAT